MIRIKKLTKSKTRDMIICFATGYFNDESFRFKYLSENKYDSIKYNLKLTGRPHSWGHPKFTNLDNYIEDIQIVDRKIDLEYLKQFIKI